MSWASFWRWLGEPDGATATAGMRTNPIEVNADAGQRVQLAFARLDAIKRTVTQRHAEGRAIAAQRMEEYRTEVRQQLAFLIGQKAITELGYSHLWDETLPGETR